MANFSGFIDGQMHTMYAGGDVTNATGFIDGCRYTLVLVWIMLVVVLMVKLHLSSLGVAFVSDCIHCLVTP